MGKLGKVAMVVMVVMAVMPGNVIHGLIKNMAKSALEALVEMEVKIAMVMSVIAAYQVLMEDLVASGVADLAVVE